jgi:hypothetical protein
VTALALLVDVVLGLLGFGISVREDLANRNGRGRFKPDSEKHVTR